MLNSPKTTYYRMTIEGQDSDKIDFEDFVNSQPEGMDFKVVSFTSEVFRDHRGSFKTKE